eukprot:161247-Amphidinium_carterae.1
MALSNCALALKCVAYYCISRQVPNRVFICKCQSVCLEPMLDFFSGNDDTQLFGKGVANKRKTSQRNRGESLTKGKMV